MSDNYHNNLLQQDSVNDIISLLEVIDTENRFYWWFYNKVLHIIEQSCCCKHIINCAFTISVMKRKKKLMNYLEIYHLKEQLP
jgi:hypothetical protein